MKNKITTITHVFGKVLKWTLYLLCAVLCLKLLGTVFAVVSTGLAVLTALAWGLAILAAGAGITYLAIKWSTRKKARS